MIYRLIVVSVRAEERGSAHSKDARSENINWVARDRLTLSNVSSALVSAGMSVTAVIQDLDQSRREMTMRGARVLLLEDDPKAKELITSSIRSTPAEVHCVSTLTAALLALDRNLFDVIVIDRHVEGWVSAQSCRHLVARARGRPVVGLIDEDCVLALRDGIEAGLTAVYYKDEVTIHLMRRLGRLAGLPNADAELAEPPRLSSARPSRAHPRSKRNP